MKKILAPMAIATLLLTGCSSADTQPQSAGSQSQSASATAVSTPIPMPDVIGMEFAPARDTLRVAGIKTKYVGPDGKEFQTAVLGETSIKATSVKAGDNAASDIEVTVTLDATETEAVARASASAAATALAVRYEFSCGGSEAKFSKDAKKFNAVSDIWASEGYGSFTECGVEIGGDWAGNSQEEIELLPSENSMVDSMAKNGGDISARDGALSDVLEACAIPPKIGWEKSKGPDNNRVQAVAIAALEMCPTAPFVSELQRVAENIPPSVFIDGAYVVGKSIQSGTYQVQVPSGANGVHNCYWERTTAQGDTIANDFISFAPQGPVVTILEGEGFVSKKCGTWGKVG